MTALFITLAIALVVIGGFLIGWRINEAGKISRVGVLFIVVALGVYFVSDSFVEVQYGTVSVVTRFGEVTDRVLDPGIHFLTPVVDDVLTYNTQKVLYETMHEASFEGSDADYKDFPVDTTTQDGQQVNVRYTIRFSIDPTAPQAIANSIGTQNQLVEKVVKAESRVRVRNVIRNYEAGQLYTGDIAEAQNEIADQLQPIFAENGLILDGFGIRQVEFQPEYVDAVEAKQIAKEDIQTAKNRAEEAKFVAEQSVTEAKAEAEKQRLLRDNTNEDVLFLKWIEKWKGEVPSIVGGEGGGFIFQMPTPNFN
jgi:regulator of protease activity HflC (stomatin/prohibitin superfamily)